MSLKRGMSFKKSDSAKNLSLKTGRRATFADEPDTLIEWELEELSPSEQKSAEGAALNQVEMFL